MKDKCVLVTGSSSGIGYEITSNLLDLGAKVIGIARNHDKSNLESKNYTTYNCDVSVHDKLEILLKQILKNHPQINCLISNAGYGNFGPLELTPDSVKVIGPTNSIQKIKSIKTELISFENVKNDLRGKIKLKLDSLENTIIENTEVEYFLNVDQFTEETVDVNINVVSNFNKSSFNFFPKTVRVKFLVSVDNYVKLNPFDFKIECYIDDLSKNDYSLEVVKKPDFIKNISLSTEKIQLIMLE